VATVASSRWRWQRWQLAARTGAVAFAGGLQTT